MGEEESRKGEKRKKALYRNEELYVKDTIKLEKSSFCNHQYINDLGKDHERMINIEGKIVRKQDTHMISPHRLF